MTTVADQTSITDPEVLKCPFTYYDHVRERSPAHFDEKGAFYVITRFDDVKRVLMDPTTFQSLHRRGSERAQAAVNRAIYEDGGWDPGPSLPSLNAPVHTDMRRVFERAFRASKIKELDSLIKEEAYELASGLLSRGGCEVVNDFAAPFTQRILAFQLGVPRTDLPLIKKWTLAVVGRLSGLLSPAEEEASVRTEVEAQRYFKVIIDRVRAQPDGSIISDLVNTPMSTGELLTDNQLMGSIMLDLFVAGSETTMNAITAGTLRLIQDPATCAAVNEDREVALRSFAEEVVRLDSPVQGLFRIASQDTELSGVAIPEGSILMVRYAAANRDPRRFNCPGNVDLGRQPAAAHLGFGSGVHHCLGAPLARRELYWAFSAILDLWKEMRLDRQVADSDWQPHLILRSLPELHVKFRR